MSKTADEIIPSAKAPTSVTFPGISSGENESTCDSSLNGNSMLWHSLSEKNVMFIACAHFINSPTTNIYETYDNPISHKLAGNYKTSVFCLVSLFFFPSTL